MYFQGQQAAEWVYFSLLLGAALPAYIYGWASGSIGSMCILYSAAVVVAVVLVVPDWPIFKRHPLVWLPKGQGTKHLEPAAGEPQSRRGVSKDKKERERDADAQIRQRVWKLARS